LLELVQEVSGVISMTFEEPFLTRNPVDPHVGLVGALSGCRYLVRGNPVQSDDELTESHEILQSTVKFYARGIDYFVPTQIFQVSLVAWRSAGTVQVITGLTDGQVYLKPPTGLSLRVTLYQYGARYSVLFQPHTIGQDNSWSLSVVDNEATRVEANVEGTGFAGHASTPIANNPTTEFYSTGKRPRSDGWGVDRHGKYIPKP
jgi:hypothetical protein